MSIQQVKLDLIDDNPYQPRSSYPRDVISDLAHSIEQVGLIHAPIARQVDGRYQICEGHLRLRAYHSLAKHNPKKWGEIPLEVRAIPDQQMALIALEENLRRKDITPIDVARAVDKYMTSFEDITEQQLGEKMGMTQGNISNMRRVLTLPTKVLEKIDEGKVSFTMGRELLIFKGLSAGKEQKWSRAENKYVDVPQDDEWLMLRAIAQIGAGYNPIPNTVDGLKKAIFNICQGHFLHLYKSGSYYGRTEVPLFNVEKAGCSKCDHCIKAYETKNTPRLYCASPKCWEKLQKQHKRQVAEEAQKKLEADVAKRVQAVKDKVTTMAAGGPKDGAITQEMPAPALSEVEKRALHEINAEKDDKKAADLPNFATVDEMCSGCINQSKCDRSMHRARTVDEHHAHYCSSRLTKKETAALAEQAKSKVLDAVQEKIKEAAGTRAEVLDIRELRLGNYNNDLKGGYVLLNSKYGGELDRMLDPAECTDRCTVGFHYAYDSGATGMYEKDELTRVHFVCTNPKCVGAKKAALTRQKNAEGMARKKAEAKAIKEVADATTEFDLPRVKLILFASLGGKHVQNSYYGSRSGLADFLCGRLGVKAKDSDSRDKANAAWKVIEKEKDVVALRQLLIEAMLHMLTDDGDIQQYKIKTTEVLNWFGVAPKVEPVKVEPGPAEAAA